MSKAFICLEGSHLFVIAALLVESLTNDRLLNNT